MELIAASYKWIRSGVGPIPPQEVPPQLLAEAETLEIEFYKEQGHFPDGFFIGVMGDTIGTIPSNGTQRRF